MGNLSRVTTINVRAFGWLAGIVSQIGRPQPQPLPTTPKQRAPDAFEDSFEEIDNPLKGFSNWLVHQLRQLLNGQSGGPEKHRIALGHLDEEREAPLCQFVEGIQTEDEKKKGIHHLLGKAEAWCPAYIGTFQRQVPSLPRTSVGPIGVGISGGVEYAKDTHPHLVKFVHQHHELVARLVNLGLEGGNDSSHPVVKVLKYVRWKDVGILLGALKVVANSCLEEGFFKAFSDLVLQAQSVVDVVGQFRTLKTEDERTSFVLNLVGHRKLLGSGNLNAFSEGMEIVSEEFFPYSSATRFERVVTKGILKNVLRYPDGRLVTMLTTHMQEGQKPSDFAVRAEQFKDLRSHIQQARKSGIPVIVVGDFNVIAEEARDGVMYASEEYELQIKSLRRDLGMTDVYRHLYPNATDYPGYTFNSLVTRYPSITPDKLPQRLDYILVSPEFIALNCEILIESFQFNRGSQTEPQSTYLSDHFPLSAILYLSSAKPPSIIYKDTIWANIRDQAQIIEFIRAEIKEAA